MGELYTGESAVNRIKRKKGNLFTATVTAYVNGQCVIDAIDVEIVVGSAWDHAYVDIMWEQAGISNYHELGLYGRMKTSYQLIEETGIGSFRITSDSYVIDVEC